MFTADDARDLTQAALDYRIEQAVSLADDKSSAFMPVYRNDWFRDSVKDELERRGFKNIELSVDDNSELVVCFEW